MNRYLEHFLYSWPSSVMPYDIARLQQACHGQGKVMEIPVFLRVTENSGNFVASQGISLFAIKVRKKVMEVCLWSLLMYIFHHSQMIFKLGQNLKLGPHSNNLPNDFFLNIICFHVLHNVQREMSTIFMMLKTFSWADLFSRPLCWSFFWWIMWFLCDF